MTVMDRGRRIRQRDTSRLKDVHIFDPDAQDIIKLVPLNDFFPWKPPPDPSAELQTSGNSDPTNTTAVTLGGPGFMVGLEVWKYSLFLACSLAAWVLYLILPRGARKEYFGAFPRRYAKSTPEARKRGIGEWIYPSSTNGSFFSSSRGTSSMLSGSATEKYLAEVAYARKVQLLSMRDSREESSLRDGSSLGRSLQPSSINTGIQSPFMNSVTSSFVNNNRDRYDTGAAESVGSIWSTSSWTPLRKPKTTQMDGSTNSVMPSIEEFSTKTPPSPQHPSIATIPSSTIIAETMNRLTERGIRLVAHGVQCDPKRVWIRMDQDTMNLSWQTEFPRRVSAPNGNVSIVLMRGSIHSIALPNVLYIDVGKRTNALQKGDTKAIPDTVCFSLLTQNGSLDLQTNSMLERDALVSCFSVMLDLVHQDRDWRALYEEGSSVMTGSEYLSNDMVEI